MREEQLYLPYIFVEQAVGLEATPRRGCSAMRARWCAAGAERTKPNTERLREYSDSALPRVVQRLEAPVPVYPELEKLSLSFSLERMREWLGPDAPIVRQLLSQDSPDTLAAKLVDGTQLARSAGAQAPVGRWRRGGGCLHGSDDRARPQRRCAGARRAQELRG